MAHTFDNETAERRIGAYIDFLMESYGTDLDGLADLAGISRQSVKRFAEEPMEKKPFGTAMKLVNLTGVSVSWLCAETFTSEGAVCNA